MQEGRNRFDDHAYKVRTVLVEWLAQPKWAREKGFLKILSQHWGYIMPVINAYGLESLFTVVNVYCRECEASLKAHTDVVNQ